MMSKKSPQLRFEGFTDDWEERKLSDVANHRGGTAIEKYFDKDGEYKVISIGSYGLNSQYVDQNIRAISNEITDGRVVNSGELTMVLNDKTANGTIIGRTLLVEKDNEYVINQRTEIISPKENFDSNFAYTILNGPFREKVKRIVQGGTQIYVNYPAVSNLNLELPKIEEQQKIGSFFKQLDDTIALHQRKLDLLKEQKKGFLQKMFPKNGAKVPELRFAGFADDWEERKLGDYIIQYSEKTKQNNQYPVFTSSRNGLFFQKDYYKGNQIASEDNTGYNIVPRGYFTYRHMSDDLVFKFNINDLADYGIVSTLYPVFTTNEQLDSKYLQYQLNEGSEFRRFSLLQKQGGSRTYMYLNKLQNMILTIPKLEEQQKIGSFFKQLDETIDLHQRKVDLLKEQKKGFLQKMFV